MPFFSIRLSTRNDKWVALSCCARTFTALALFTVLALPASHPASAHEADADEKLTASEIDADSFGFSVPALASSIGVKLRSLLGSKNGVDRVSRIIEPKALRYSYYRPAFEVLSAWIKRSSSAGLIRVNQPVKPGFVNFFILDHNHLATNAPTLSCNCSYVPGSWSILCDELFLSSAKRMLHRTVSDAGLLEDAQPQQDQTEAEKEKETIRQLFKEADQGLQNFLFEWIIAHELGHLVRSHSEADLVRSWTDNNGVPIGLAAEREADEFYISTLQHDQKRQFWAWLGLSNVITKLYRDAVFQQYTQAEIDAQIKKHGRQFIFQTELDIKVRYASNRHPPLLLRALNLADLVIVRYPSITDGSGYFENLRKRIKLVSSAEPDVPPLCRTGFKIDEDSSEEQLLAKHADILATQSAPVVWTQTAIEMIRKKIQSINDPELVAIHSRSTDLLEALVAPPEAARAKIEAVEAAADKLEKTNQATVRLLSLVTRARTGLLPATLSLKGAIEQAEKYLNEMIASGEIDPNNPREMTEAWRLLLRIALSRPEERDPAMEETIDGFLIELINLRTKADLDDQLLRQILETDFTRLGQSAPANDRADIKVNSATRVAALADDREWPLIEKFYLASQLALMEAIRPEPRERLVFGYNKMGGLLRVSGPTENAPSMFEKALHNLDSLLGQLPPADKAQAARARLTLLNNLGHALIAVRRFLDAKAPLKLALEGRLTERAGRMSCDKSHQEDVEFATVSQNLADVSLALGDFAEALSFARQARSCRSEIGRELKAVESQKTEGYALIYSGEEDAGRKLLQEYSVVARRILDYHVLPPDDLFFSGAVVKGDFVPLDRFVTPVSPR